MQNVKNNYILYLEDDKAIAELFISLFEDLPVVIEHFYDAESAMEDLDVNKYRLIIADIELPGKNGLYFVKEVRKISQDIPIVILSAYDDKEYLFDAIETRVTKYITKPINMKTFVNDICSIVDSNKRNRIKFENGFEYNLFDHKFIDPIGNEILLTISEHIILTKIYKHKNHLVTYEEILSCLENTSIDTLRTHIKNIRKKSYKAIIKTVPTLGYKIEIK